MTAADTRSNWDRLTDRLDRAYEGYLTADWRDPYRETPAEVICPATPDADNACRRIDCRTNGCAIERWDE